jgi:hypothetical protein
MFVNLLFKRRGETMFHNTYITAWAIVCSTKRPVSDVTLIASVNIIQAINGLPETQNLFIRWKRRKEGTNEK